MQVSATLIAAQQAAREAQANFQARIQTQHAQTAPAQKSPFAAALEQTQGFSSLPLKQTAAPANAASPQAAPQANTGTRLGQHINITV